MKIWRVERLLGALTFFGQTALKHFYASITVSIFCTFADLPLPLLGACLSNWCAKYFIRMKIWKKHHRPTVRELHMWVFFTCRSWEMEVLGQTQDEQPTFQCLRLINNAPDRIKLESSLNFTSEAQTTVCVVHIVISLNMSFICCSEALLHLSATLHSNQNGGGPRPNEDFRHFHQPATAWGLNLQGCVMMSAHFFLPPKHSGKIYNSLKQNLSSCITAATALKRCTRSLPFFWMPSMLRCSTARFILCF